MAYIIKNTAGLINTRLTDVGRRNLSQCTFNISYFQIGDSEVSYTAVPNYNQTNNNILMPAFNAQNDTGSPQSNKQNIKKVSVIVPVPGPLKVLIDDIVKLNGMVSPGGSDGVLTI